MQPDQMKDALFDSVRQALETMAFILADEAQEATEIPTTAKRISMSFTGPTSGTVELIASESFGQTLAAGALGLDPADEEVLSKVDDALKELINVVVGHMMPAIAEDRSDVFSLALPELGDIPADDWSDFIATPSASVFVADGAVIAARVTK